MLARPQPQQPARPDLAMPPPPAQTYFPRFSDVRPKYTRRARDGIVRRQEFGPGRLRVI